MNIVLGILLVLEVVSSFLLISVILLQKSKGGGLSGSAFGGGGGDSLFGARAGNVLTKITIILAIFFMLNTMLLAFFYAGRGEGSIMEDVGGPVEVRDVLAEDISPEETLPLELPPIASDPAGLGDTPVPDVPDDAAGQPAK